MGQQFFDIAGHDLRRRTVKGFVEQARALRWFEIEFNAICARPPGLGDKTGGRVDIAAGADGDEQVSGSQSLVDLRHVVGHFAEPDDVWSHGPGEAALPTARIKCQVPGPLHGIAAVIAKRACYLTMHMDDGLAARRLMQIVNVLGHNGNAAAVLALKSRQGIVAGIGLDAIEAAAAFIIKVLHQLRVARKAFGRCHIAVVHLRPDAVLVAKSLNPRFRRQAGAGENDNVLIFCHNGRHLDWFGPGMTERGYSCTAEQQGRP